MGTFGGRAVAPSTAPKSFARTETRPRAWTGTTCPSLLGVGLGAPYLHNGAAVTLEELFDPEGEFTAHLRAGNQVFAPTPDQVRDLIAFLRTIDDDTETFDLPAGFQLCPQNVIPLRPR